MQIIKDFKLIVGNEGGFIGGLFKKAAGAIGTIAGSALGGPIGSVLGGGIGKAIEQQHAEDRQDRLRASEIAHQERFAKNALKWKVQDAKEAGIHPLAALGASTVSPSPTLVGGSGGGLSTEGLGQDISRAISAGMNKHQKKLLDLQVGSANADFEMKKLELIEKRRQVLGSPNDPGVQRQDVRVNKGVGHIERGKHPIYTHIDAGQGVLRAVPSEKYKEATEDNMLQEIPQSLEIISGKDNTKPPKSKWAKGAIDYYYSLSDMGWKPVFKGQKKPQKIQDKLRKMRKKDKYKLWKGSGPLYKKFWNK